MTGVSYPEVVARNRTSTSRKQSGSSWGCVDVKSLIAIAVVLFCSCSVDAGGPLSGKVDAQSPAGLDAQKHADVGPVVLDGGVSVDAEVGVDGERPASHDAGAPMTCIGAIGTRTLRGTAVDDHIGETAAEPAPVDLTAALVNGLVLTPAGCFASYPGTGTATGSFSIRQLPPGPVYLRIALDEAPTYLVTELSEIELGSAVSGRRDLVRAAPNTSVDLRVSGLTPWQIDDDMEVVSFGARSFAFGLPFGLPSSPNVGDTFLQASIGYTAAHFSEPFLIDSTRGDKIFILHLMTRRSGGLTYQSVERSARLDGITMSDAQSVAITATVTADGTIENTSFTWRRSQFSSAAAQVNPSSAMTSGFLAVEALPEVSRGFYDSAADLVELLSNPSDSSDLSGAFEYRNPFPARVERFMTTSFSIEIPDALPGTSEHFFSTFVARSLAGSGSSTEIVVDTGPVQTLLINGLSAFDDHAGVGLSPTVSWSVPAGGRPGVYSVQIHRYKVVQRKTEETFVGKVLTTDTQVRLPPGLLSIGASHRIVVSAVTSGDVDFARAPFRLGLPDSYYPVVSGLIVP